MRARGTQLRGYRRSLETSYALGDFAALELLRHRPAHARRLYLSASLKPERRDELGRLAAHHGVPCAQDDALIARFAHRGGVNALAVFAKYPMRLAPEADHLVLLEPQDPGNLGSILRTAAAFACPQVALVGERPDPFNPHVVRASIGACFLVESEVFPDLASYRARFPRTLHPVLQAGATPLPEARFARPSSLLFGSEWPGLPPAAARLGPSFGIPQDERVESLNLAAAVAVALYERRRSSYTARGESG
mgnify:CR=1 FL=1